MKLLSATNLAFCMFSKTFAETVVRDDNSPRSIDNYILDKRATLNTPPLNNPLCGGQVVKIANIASAVQCAADLVSQDRQIG